jgi:hypothetical protein
MGGDKDCAFAGNRTAVVLFRFSLANTHKHTHTHKHTTIWNFQILGYDTMTYHISTVPERGKQQLVKAKQHRMIQ